jgi:hypothetical protein
MKKDLFRILFLSSAVVLSAAPIRADAGVCLTGSFACGVANLGEVYTFTAQSSLPKGSTFSNTWSFSLASATPMLVGIARDAGFRIGGTNYGGIGDLDIKLYQGSTVMPVDEGGSGRNRTFESYFGLNPGNYSLVVSGTVRSDYGPGSNFGSFVAMVPEAETFVVMALGMGMVGWFAKRRQKAQRKTQEVLSYA